MTLRCQTEHLSTNSDWRIAPCSKYLWCVNKYTLGYFFGECWICLENMEQEGPWETMRAEQENGELLSEDERMEASKEFREEDPQGNVKEGIS